MEMRIRNFQIENKLSKVKIKKIQMPQLSFGVLNPLTYIVVILTLIHIIIASSRILVNFFKGEHVIRKNGALR